MFESIYVVVYIVKKIVYFFTNDTVYLVFLALLTNCQMTAFAVYNTNLALFTFQARMTKVWRFFRGSLSNSFDYSLTLACLVGFFFENSCLDSMV